MNNTLFHEEVLTSNCIFDLHILLQRRGSHLLYKRWKRRRRRGPLPLKHVLLISFILFNVLTAYSLWFINRVIEPTLINIAETNTRQVAEHAIQDAVSKIITEDLDMNELIIIRDDKANESKSYSFNSQLFNRLISDASLHIQKYLNGDIEKELKDMDEVNVYKNPNGKGLMYHIPLGLVTDNALLANLGPKVPISFEMIGSVNSDIETKYHEMGINNAYLEIYMHIEVKMNVIVPSFKKNMVIKNSVKIGDLFIEGDVPQFYNHGGSVIPPAITPSKDEGK